ncbi:MAG: hypothetical protein NTW49_10565 [Bacteroidia bacterium]|nr:hypothetical protein [Bacteroidia bacterium]
MKIYRITGHVIFLIMLIFSAFFYLERMVYADTAYYIFRMLNTAGLSVEHGRDTMVLLQLLPVLAIKLHFSLKTVVMLYSVSIILIYYLLFNIAVYVLKSDGAGLIIALILIIGVWENFYNPVTETHLGLVFSTLLYAWLNFYDNLKNIKYPAVLFFLPSFLIICLSVYSHPVTLFAVFFIVMYHMCNKKYFRQFRYYALLLLIVILYFLKNILYAADSNEKSHLMEISALYHNLHGFFQYYSTQWVVSRLWSIYLMPQIILVILLIWLIIKKKIAEAALIIISVMLFLLITCFVFRQGDANIMMEKDFMTVNYFILLPFIHELIYNAKFNAWLKTSFLIIIATVSFIHIYNIGKVYHERISYIKNLVESTKRFDERKFLIPKSKVKMEDVMVPWAFSIETLIISSLDSPDDARTIYIVNNNELDEIDLNQENLFLKVIFDLKSNSDELSKRYFSLPHGIYRLLEDDDNNG